MTAGPQDEASVTPDGRITDALPWKPRRAKIANLEITSVKPAIGMRSGGGSNPATG